MRELRDHKNKTIIRNYVAMPDKPLFSTLEVASATGVCLKTVQNVMRVLYRHHVIQKTGTMIGGRVYYRVSTAEELAWWADVKSKSDAVLAMRDKVLKHMESGVWYSSKVLRKSAQLPQLEYAFLREMAEEGLIEMKSHQLKPDGAASYYWKKG